MKTHQANPEKFVSEMISILDLPPEWANQTGVIDNIASLIDIAQLLDEFPLPDDLDVAPIFKP